MKSRASIFQSLPYDVEKQLKHLGQRIRLARTRRNVTIQEIAERIGSGPRAVMDAEKGKPSTGIGVYAALLWALDLHDALKELADPSKDEVGLRWERIRGRVRARRSRGNIDNDF